VNGIASILQSGQFPGFIIRDGKTEQRKLEDESAKGILKLCEVMQERDGTNFMAGSGMRPEVVKHVWQSELADGRKNSITERYDDRVERAEEAGAKLDDKLAVAGV
jgi:hypothetical protein